MRKRYEFGDARDEFLSVRPGITGWWQVTERNAATWANGDRQMLELFYVRHASLALDLRIFARTFKAMLGEDGEVMSEPIIRRDVVVGVAAHRPYRMPGDPAYLPSTSARRCNPGACPGFQPDDEGESRSRPSTPATPSSRASTGCGKTSTRSQGTRPLPPPARQPGPLAPPRAGPVRPRGDGGGARGPWSRQSGVVLARRRNYCIETVYGHYGHTFDAAHLDACRGVLADMCPGYLPAWDRRMRARRRTSTTCSRCAPICSTRTAPGCSRSSTSSPAA